MATVGPFLSRPRLASGVAVCVTKIRTRNSGGARRSQLPLATSLRLGTGWALELGLRGCPGKRWSGAEGYAQGAGVQAQERDGKGTVGRASF